KPRRCRGRPAMWMAGRPSSKTCAASESGLADCLYLASQTGQQTVFNLLPLGGQRVHALAILLLVDRDPAQNALLIQWACRQDAGQGMQHIVVQRHYGVCSFIQTVIQVVQARPPKIGYQGEL